MRLRRQPEVTGRRQRLPTDETPKLSSFTYSSRQSAGPSERQGRQATANRPVSRPKNIGLFVARRAGLLIFLVVLVASAINVLRLSSSVQVRPLDQTANQAYLQSSQVYAAAASQRLNASIWNHNKITVDSSDLSRYLMRQFPELTNVSVTMPLLAHEPLIYVQAAQPALVLNTSNGSFIIGTAGKALAEVASNASIPGDLPFVTDGSGLQVKVRQQALPANDVKFIQIVVAELAAKQIKVSNISLPAASSEADAHLVGQAYYVKFNLQDTNPAGEAGSFLATINSLNKQNIKPASYVDVRVEGRAYYQ